MRGRIATAAWLALGSLVIVTTFGWTTFGLVQLLAHAEHTTHSSRPAAGITALDVQTDGGTVDVVGTDRPTIAITAHVSVGLRAPAYPRHVVGSTYQVRVVCPRFVADTWCRIDLRIEVPRSLAVVVRGADQRVSVTGTTGPVSVRTGDGPIRLSQLSAPVEVHTSDGHVTATHLTSTQVTSTASDGATDLGFDRPPASVTASSADGHVDVAVPPGTASYAVSTHTAGGHTANDLRTDPRAARTITVRTADGSITLRYEG